VPSVGACAPCRQTSQVIPVTLPSMLSPLTPPERWTDCDDFPVCP
jgi:hypothetical protein